MLLYFLLSTFQLVVLEIKMADDDLSSPVRLDMPDSPTPFDEDIIQVNRDPTMAVDDDVADDAAEANTNTTTTTTNRDDISLSSPIRFTQTSPPTSPSTHHRRAAQPTAATRRLANVFQTAPSTDAAGLTSQADGFFGDDDDDNAFAGDAIAVGAAGGDGLRRVIWGTDVDIDLVRENFRLFLNDFIDPATQMLLYPALLEQMAQLQQTVLNISCAYLKSFDATLYRQAIEYPSEVLALMDTVVYDELRAIHARVVGDGETPLPPHVQLFQLDEVAPMRALNPRNIDQLVAVRGMVIRASPIIPEMKQAFHRCIMCKHSVTTSIDRGVVTSPHTCSNCRAVNVMELIHNRCVFTDKQLVKLQETPDAIPDGDTPHTVQLVAYDKLVDVARPGDRVEVTGVFRAVPLRDTSRQRSVKSIFKTYIDVVHFKKTDKRRLAGDVDDDRDDYIAAKHAADAAAAAAAAAAATAAATMATVIVDEEDVGTAADEHIEGDETRQVRETREAELRKLAERPDIYELLVRSLAPSIWQLDDVKKGILCLLFGGTNKDFSDQGFGRTRGDINILLCGDPGTSKCLGRGTPVLRSDGSFVPVESVAVGDRLVGDDGTPRRVLALTRGREQMVSVMLRHRKLAPQRDDDELLLFTCNLAHVLTLKANGLVRIDARRDGSWCAEWHESIDIAVGDIAHAIKKFSRRFASRDEATAFVERRPCALVDGRTIDIAVRDYLLLPLGVRRSLKGFCAPALELSGADFADAYDVGVALARANVRVPHAYRCASSASRRSLLAGIVDARATRNRDKRSWRLDDRLSSELTSDIEFVARSLGLCVERSTVSGSGCDLVPVRLQRKRVCRDDGGASSSSSLLLFDIEIVPLAIDDYFGFSLDGNARFVVGERFVVTHNSNLLSYVHKLAPRGIYTSGKGSSAVGLTAYITKDPDTGESVLESGALVLSDRGVCCIDEFDKMSDGTRAVLHEVMEQQTVSVAKAGIVCTLNARTSILASANPIESRYNPNRSVVENLDLPPTLLSRFDLIYLVLDKPNEATDRHLARHLVQLYWQDPPGQPDVLPVETMTRYISYARKRCHPLLTDDAAEALVRRYTQMRRLGASNRTVSATPRQLESLVRLAEALARMRLAAHVEARDVNEASRLLSSAMQTAAIDPRTGRVDMDLIHTGRSAAQRTHVHELAAELKRFLSSRTVVRFQQLQALMQQQSSIEVTAEDLRDALRMLSDEEFVTMGGDPRNETIRVANTSNKRGNNNGTEDGVNEF